MRALIGLGSSEGDRLGYLRSAVHALDAGTIPQTTLVAVSAVYETRPVGPSPHALLLALKALEDAHGRVRSTRWGSRTLDLDLLLMFDEGRPISTSTDRLRLPHPEVFSRDFVMRPLLDLDPDLAIAGTGIAERLRAVPTHDRTILRRLNEPLLSE
jgi:2-amino-4-hydroxy-6-hydroxymethyldihydropteridine diphosphokinase